MTVINTNSAATLTANALTQNQRAMSQTMERLSTGSRINSASDDAAGLAMVSKMDAQIRGTNMAVKNANDAISMIQTADGAAIEIDAMLQRMREIAIQAQNSTNTDDDLTNMNLEFAQLATEIDRVATTTEYNDTKIMNASQGGGADTDGKFDFTITANSDTIEVDFADFELVSTGAEVLGTQTITMTTANVQGNAVTTDSYKITFANDQVMTISLAQIVTAANANATDITNDEFVAAFNTANAAQADNASTVPDVTATITGNDITFTEVTGGSAGKGAIARIEIIEADGDIRETMPSTNALATGVTGRAAATSVYGSTDLSDFKTAKTGNNGEAQKTTTITELDAAIAGVASQRASFGAFVNRLEHTVDNLTNVSQNTVAARSRIEDADYAAETTELARTQIIAQAATAMLSQANQQQQSVLALLK
jgi:flagellin